MFDWEESVNFTVNSMKEFHEKREKLKIANKKNKNRNFRFCLSCANKLEIGNFNNSKNFCDNCIRTGLTYF